MADGLVLIYNDISSCTHQSTLQDNLPVRRVSVPYRAYFAVASQRLRHLTSNLHFISVSSKTARHPTPQALVETHPANSQKLAQLLH